MLQHDVVEHRCHELSASSCVLCRPACTITVDPRVGMFRHWYYMEDTGEDTGSRVSG